MDLRGKTALVTGAASGIGKACAKRLVEDGMNVVIADLNFEGAQKACEEISKEKTLPIKMDVTDEASVCAGIQEAVRVFGGLDVLVANAGIQIVHPFDEFPFEDWKKLQAIHGDGSFLTAREAFKQMKASGKGGQIIFMGSAHSHTASKLKVGYVFAKHGILGMSRVIAKEGAEYGIHSYTIRPGFVRTPLVEKQIPEQAQSLGISEEEVIKNVMLKDTGDGIFTTVEDVAEMVSFCAEDNGVLTGQSFIVSAGWIMK